MLDHEPDILEPHPRANALAMISLVVMLCGVIASQFTACTGALAGGTLGGGGGTVSHDPVYYFGIVACAVPVAQTDPCQVPVPDATVLVHHADGYVQLTTNGDGYALVNASIPFSDVRIAAKGFVDFAFGPIEPPKLDGHNVTFSLTPDVPPLPAPPTRDEILNLHLTFQGLYCDTQQFGRLPWFEAALPWLTPADRASCYAAKHTSPAWGPGGDTHALINLPSGPPLYDEGDQPYSADRFPALDWTAGGTHIDGRLADLVAETVRAGFKSNLLFLGGDDGSTCEQVPTPPQCGFVIAMHQLDLVHDALIATPYGDLRGYVVPFPGYDGVFFGYTPDQVAQWGAKCRQLFLYCGLEHQPGRIPVGEGGGDYLPGGRMSTFDLILAEFNGPGDSAWRTQRAVDGQGRPDYPGNQIWQIGARMLGPLYRRPSDQPADADSGSPPFYLALQSPRGPFVHCAFEWVGEYNFVRGRETTADEQRARDYFTSAGWTCGG